MPLIPTNKRVSAYEKQRAELAWKRLCEAKAKQKELERTAFNAKLCAILHSAEVQEAQNSYNEIMGE